MTTVAVEVVTVVVVVVDEDVDVEFDVVDVVLVDVVAGVVDVDDVAVVVDTRLVISFCLSKVIIFRRWLRIRFVLCIQFQFRSIQSRI